METTPITEEKRKRDYLMPGSILVAALLVSISLVYNAGVKTATPQAANLGNAAAPNAAAPAVATVGQPKPIGPTDHIMGNPAAPVKVIEYSDLECPFCKEFQPTMQKIVSDYAGQVAWVFREFPLAQLHPKAPHEAEAAECAAEVGGNDGFWAFINRLYAVTPSNNGLDPAQLPQIAADVNLDASKFATCLSSGKYASVVAASAAEAQSIGAQGTPFSVVITKSGKLSVLNGAYPYAQVKAVIDQALQS